MPCVASCIPFNVADLPVGVLPVTRVNDKDLVGPGPSPSRSSVRSQSEFLFQDDLRHYPRHTDHLHELAYQTSLDTLGLPLGIQIVGKPNCEETILCVMKMVEENRRENFP